MMKVKCGNCKSFIEKDQALRIGLSSFCDRACFTEKNNKSKPVKKIKNKSKPKQDSNLVDAIIKRDGCCKLCGKRGSNLAVHHIIYRSTPSNKEWENEPWNLISLCAYCHIDVIHSSKKIWQKVCLAYTWLKYVDNITFNNLYKLEKWLSDNSFINADI